MKKKKSIVRIAASVVGVLLCLILLPILAMNLTIIIKSYINPDQVPDFMGIKPFIVVTGSMEGTIDGGDLVITKVVDPKTLKTGDIISYKVEESVITHRIIGMTELDGEPAFIMKGDANNTEDEQPVTYDQVESIYQFRIAGMGSLAMFMQTPAGMLVFIGIPVLLFIIYDIIQRKIQTKKDSKKENAVQAELEQLRTQLENQKKNDRPVGEHDSSGQ